MLVAVSKFVHCSNASTQQDCFLVWQELLLLSASQRLFLFSLHVHLHGPNHVSTSFMPWSYLGPDCCASLGCYGAIPCLMDYCGCIDLSAGS